MNTKTNLNLLNDIYQIIDAGYENDFYMRGTDENGFAVKTCRIELCCCGPDGGEDLIEVSGLQKWDVTMTVSQFAKQFIQFTN